MSDTLIRINEWLNYVFAYGPFWVYAVLFLACFVENLIPPFPGDTFIVAAGGLVALGRLNLVICLALILAGGLASVMLLYALGGYYGRDFFIRKDYKYFSASDIRGMERSFRRWGALILVGSRFVVGARAVLALVAGISRYPVVRMFVYSFFSYVLFCGLLVYLGIKLAENIDLIQKYVKTYEMIVWPVLIAVVLIWLIYKIRSVRKANAS
jgi:membrane protein DedA with SNARE-associated domain